MDTYLSQTRKSVECISDYETIHAVLGNAAADLDSVISSLVQAFYLYQINSSPKTLIVPVLNIPRSDYYLKTETIHILKQHRITAELLTFRDDLNLLELHNLKKLKLTLVDQNVLPNKDLPLEECVVRVIDHRSRERPESSFCNVTVEPVGSCCTLIADEIFKGSYSNQIDVTVATLLFTTILLDTVNMSKDAGRGTAKDEEMLQRLEVVIPNACREKTFKEIQDVKYDLSNFTTLDILQKDLKVISGNGTSIAMCSITMKIQDFIKREALENSLNKFAELQATKAVVLMGVIVINGKTLRDLGIFSLSKNFQDKIIESLKTCDTPDLNLEVIPHDSKNLVVFSQGNNKANRKMVLPILKSLLTSEDFSSFFSRTKENL